jgi:nitrate/nitrite transporter NarK
MVWAAVSLLLSTIPGQPFPLVMVWLSLVGAGAFSWNPPFWQLPTLTLGESAAAASIGLINSVGNLGGFVGPSVMGYLLSKGHGYPTVAIILAFSYLTSAALIASLRFPTTLPKPLDDALQFNNS